MMVTLSELPQKRSGMYLQYPVFVTNELIRIYHNCELNGDIGSLKTAASHRGSKNPNG